MSSRVTVHAAQLTEGGVTDWTPVTVVCTHVCRYVKGGMIYMYIYNDNYYCRISEIYTKPGK